MSLTLLPITARHRAVVVLNTVSTGSPALALGGTGYRLGIARANARWRHANAIVL